MIYRTLERGEWDRIDQITYWNGWKPDPQHGLIVIAEDEHGSIKGTLAAVDTVHIDGAWVDPDARSGTTLAHLFKKMRSELDHIRVPRAICWVDRADTADYARRLGMTKIPADSFLFEIK